MIQSELPESRQLFISVTGAFAPKSSARENNKTFERTRREGGGVFAMKNFQEFCECVCEHVRGILGEDYTISMKSVRKNNNITMEGLLIRYLDSSVAPTIYLNPYYEQYSEGRTISHIAEEVAEIYRNNRDPWKEAPSFEFSEIRDKILFRVINRGLNEEELMHMPHVEIGDFAVGFQWVVDTDDRRLGSVRVTDEQAESWGVTTDELTKLAVENSARDVPPVLKSIEEVLHEIVRDNGGSFCGLTESELKESSSEQEFPMYVLTNSRSHMGASALLALPFLDEFRERIGEDFWILPSSIHEVILVPVSKVEDRAKLCAMVREINETQVPPQEVLSDEVYSYGEFEDMMPVGFRAQLQARA